MMTLIDAWESEGVLDHVVAGEPAQTEALEAELVDVATGAGPREETNGRAKHLPVLYPFVRLNLNARIRARLTPAGIAGLYAARHKVAVPADIVQNGGVWETELWSFMSVFGAEFCMGQQDVPTVDNVIDVDPMVSQRGE